MRVAQADLDAVTAQLGRPPRGVLDVAHRCPCGQPAVVRTSPRLPDGTPFTTLYYLTCARLADPAEVEAQARSRLGFVVPGEVPYVVQLPSAPVGPATGPGSGALWYRTLWRQVAEGSP